MTSHLRNYDTNKLPLTFIFYFLVFWVVSHTSLIHNISLKSRTYISKVNVNADSKSARFECSLDLHVLFEKRVTPLY